MFSRRCKKDVRRLHVLSIMLMVILGSLVYPGRKTGAVFYVDVSEEFLSNAISQTLSAAQIAENGFLTWETNAGNLTLEMVVPQFQVEQVTNEDGSCDVLHLDGYGQTEAVGWPRLPVKGAMVAIPADSEPRLVVLDTGPMEIAGKFDLCPVERPIVEFGPLGEPQYAGQEMVRDARAYALDGFNPEQAVELTSTGFVRSQRVAQLVFQPFQYNPVSGELRYYPRIKVVIDFSIQSDEYFKDQNLPDSIPDADTGPDEGVFEAILRDNLVNYEQGRMWRSPTPRSAHADLGPTVQEHPAYKLLVDQDGLYQVSYTDLQAAGAPVDELDPRNLRLHNQGVEVALSVAGEGDGSFNPQDYLLFYGQKAGTKYTDTNVYWFTWESEPGKRMSVQDAALTGGANVSEVFSATLRVEENKGYQSSRPSGPDSDHWYWEMVYAAGSPVSKSYSFDLQHIATAPISATVRGLFKGYSASPNHHTQVYLNGQLIDDTTWSSEAEYFFEVDVPQSDLVDGQNEITVKCPLDGGITKEIFFVNWFEIVYADTYVAEEDVLWFNQAEAGDWEVQVGGFATEAIELYDISTPSAPVRILGDVSGSEGDGYQIRFEGSVETGRDYLALTSSRRLAPLEIIQDETSDLRSPSNGADYIFITHEDFYSDVLPLADFRAAQGLRTVVVDVQDVYDEFSGGLLDPNAIHDFLAHAYANWQFPAPTYVLLVGDGTYDYQDYKGTGEKNYIPPYLANADPWTGETAIDNYFVSVSGDDNLPDIYIGRLPVKTSSEAAALVTKILDYENTPPQGGWNEKVLFVADNADSAGDFGNYSNAVADHYLPEPYTAQKVYYKVTHSTVSSTKAAIIGAINEGQLLVNYVGHANPYWWADEKLLDSFADFDSFTNSGMLPLLVQMTCLSGYFINPSPPDQDVSSIGEKIVRMANKGAIASWSSSGMGTAGGQDYLNRGLYRAVFEDGEARLGPAATQAKYYLYANTGGYRYLLDIYTLFGDPALGLNVVRADVEVSLEVEPGGPIMTGEPITYTLSYTNTGLIMAEQVVIQMGLPAEIVDPVVSSSGASLTQRPESRFTWDAAELSPSEGGEIIISGVVSVDYSRQVTIQANITSLTPEADQANNSAGPIETIAINPDALIIQNATVIPVGGSVQISWQIDTAANIIGFNIYRARNPEGEQLCVYSGLGTEGDPLYVLDGRYTYLDGSTAPGETYYYWIEVMDPYTSATTELPSGTTNFLVFIPVVTR